ncbi:hypothetical protein DM785_02665 [Deinococcus actinosclerus]|nr:hypothetical protein DM785_02665 [Deinococcus actinosclerus]
MLPSELLALIPDIGGARLGIPDVNADTNDRALLLTGALVQAATVDMETLTGQPWTDVGATAREREAFACLLSAAALRFIKRRTAADAASLHNPDAPQGTFPLDLVRVIGRAERADVQRARRLLGGNWLAQLGGVRARR